MAYICAFQILASTLWQCMIFPSNVTRQCEDLAQLLGTPCMPYLRSGESTPNVDNSQSIYVAALASDANVVIKAVERASKQKCESLLPAQEQRSVFAIPLIGIEGNQWYAIGRCDSPPSEQGQKLLHAAVEANRRQHQIDSQGRVILNAESDLERSQHERAWLRQLNAQGAIRKKAVGQQSRQAIESLRSLIEAEAIAIYLYADRETENHGLESAITSKSQWTIEDVRLLLQRLDKPCCGGAAVLNCVEYPLINGVLHSCVVVPLGETDPIGFVVAMNRANPSRNKTMRPCEEAFNDGDVELLHEIAGYLSADGYSNAHLIESEQLVLGTLRAMSNAIEARDPYTHGHSERVGNVGYQIARRLNLSEISCQEIYLAGVLHDIGKIGIPDKVLLKPGKLEPEEFAIIQKHPEIGHRILEELGKLRFALPGVLYHHERVDGGGYPHQLVGDEIPLMARVLAVSDAFDAMTSSRVYRNAMGQKRAVEILLSGMNSQWDSDAVLACVQYVEEILIEPTSDALKSKPTDWRQVSQALRVLQL